MLVQMLDEGAIEQTAVRVESISIRLLSTWHILVISNGQWHIIPFALSIERRSDHTEYIFSEITLLNDCYC